MILGDLGADVIKVESPHGGDGTRQWGPPFAGGEAAYYLFANRNKRSVVLDLKSPEGVNAVKEIARKSDVFIENFRVGKARELGVGYEDIKKVNERIIYCSISGFGQDGPYRDLPGYDFVIQAMSGLMSITGSPDGEPMKFGVPIVDLVSGLYAAVSILGALIYRRETGKGQYIDISLYDSAVSILANVGSNYLVSGEVPGRHGNAHPNIVPYQAFRASDGYVAVGIGNDAQWRKFCAIVGREDLSSDERFETNEKRVENRKILIPILEEIFVTEKVDFWVSKLREAGIPVGPINTVDRVFADPQTLARGMLSEIPHPTIGVLKAIGSPIKFSETPVKFRLHPPLHGEHTEEILSEFGFHASSAGRDGE